MKLKSTALHTEQNSVQRRIETYSLQKEKIEKSKKERLKFKTEIAKFRIKIQNDDQRIEDLKREISKLETVERSGQKQVERLFFFGCNYRSTN